jgi:hypothetical protein
MQHFSRYARFLPLAILLLLALFPYGWLGELWPATGDFINEYFYSARRHAVGHVFIFLFLGLAVLMAFPNLKERPWLFFGIMLVAALGQEFFQAVYKNILDIYDTSRDIFTDMVGLMVAFGLVWLVKVIRYGYNTKT